MLYLLDTNCLIWFQENNSIIPRQVLEKIENPENKIQQHRDPFDRLLIAKAKEINATIITPDKHFQLYDNFIKVLWQYKLQYNHA